MKELYLNYEVLAYIKRYRSKDPVVAERALKNFILNSGFSVEELVERGFYCFGGSDKEEWEEIFWNGYCLKFHVLPQPEELKMYRVLDYKYNAVPCEDGVAWRAHFEPTEQGITAFR